MENVNHSRWWVRSDAGEVFGPVSAQGLLDWAQEGRIFPEDRVSADQKEWRPAREQSFLQMDTMILHPNGKIAGPFHAKAVEALRGAGKVPSESMIYTVSEILEKVSSSGTVEEEESEAALRVYFEEQMEQLRTEANDERNAQLREIETLKAALSEAQNQPREEGISVAEYEAAQEQLTELQEQLRELRKQLEKAHADAVQTRGDFEAQLAAAEASAGDMHDLKAQLAAAKSEAAEADAEADAVKDELAVVKEALAAVEAEAGDAKAEAAAAKAGYEALKAQAEEAGNKARELQNEAEFHHGDLISLRSTIEELRKENAELTAEYTELLEFSNQRDTQTAAQIAHLEEKLAQTHAQTPQEALPMAEELGGDARTIALLQNKVTELTRERSDLVEKLTQAQAAAAIARHPLEGDIAVIKQFSEEALEALRTNLQRETARNEEERNASFARQKLLQEEIQRLEIAMRRDPGEKTRAELMEEQNERTIAQLRQELEAQRNLQKADMTRYSQKERVLEGRIQALQHSESMLREQLRRVEQRTADYDSLTSQLRRREEDLLAAEQQFSETRQQWQSVEALLNRRIEELERGAGSLFEGLEGRDPKRSDSPEAQAAQAVSEISGASRRFVAPSWMRNMR